MKSFSIIGLAATAAAALSPRVAKPFSGAGLKVDFDQSVINSAALDAFNSTPIAIAANTVGPYSRRDEEPDPNRPDVIPEYIFVLQCTESGFRGDCLVFGAPPGACVSYFSFQPGNSTDISDAFNNKVLSLSTNTGGKCQFYKYKGCDNKGDDRGLTSSYNYNLGVPLPSDPRTVEYDKKITSWRC